MTDTASGHFYDVGKNDSLKVPENFREILNNEYQAWQC